MSRVPCPLPNPASPRSSRACHLILFALLMLQAAFTFYDKLKAFDEFEYGYTLKVTNERPCFLSRVAYHLLYE